MWQLAKKYCLSKIALLFGLLIVSAPVLAESTSIGTVAEGLWGPTVVLSRLMEAAAYVLGFTLLMFSAIKYKSHRQNPKIVPLSIPIVLLFSGAILVGIPYVTTHYGVTWNPKVQEEAGEPEGGEFITGGPRGKQQESEEGGYDEDLDSVLDEYLN
jgi:hypothetical protein